MISEEAMWFWIEWESTNIWTLVWMNEEMMNVCMNENKNRRWRHDNATDDRMMDSMCIWYDTMRGRFWQWLDDSSNDVWNDRRQDSVNDHMCACTDKEVLDNVHEFIMNRDKPPEMLWYCRWDDEEYNEDSNDDYAARTSLVKWRQYWMNA